MRHCVWPSKKVRLLRWDLLPRVVTVMMRIAGPVVTDNGNFVIDAPFDREKMQDPSKVRYILSITSQHSS